MTSTEHESFLTKQRAAIHEAGHAASFFQNGIGILRCHIRLADHQYAGAVVGQVYEQWPVERLESLAAGFLAERLIDDVPGEEWPSHAQHDHHEFNRILGDMADHSWPEEQVAAAQKAALDAALSCVENQREAVLALSRFLEDNPTRPPLSGHEARCQTVVSVLRDNWAGDLPTLLTPPSEDAPFPMPPTSSTDQPDCL